MHAAVGGGGRSHPLPRALGGCHTALRGMLGGMVPPGGGQRHAGRRGRGPQPAARGGAPTCLECNTAAQAGLAVRSWTVKREKNRADAAARGAAAAQSMIETAPDPYVPCSVREGRWQGRGGAPHCPLLRCAGQFAAAGRFPAPATVLSPIAVATHPWLKDGVPPPLSATEPDTKSVWGVFAALLLRSQPLGTLNVAELSGGEAGQAEQGCRCLRWVDTEAMAGSCLAVVQACLSGEPWQGACACSPKDGRVCTAAPNRITLLHALAMAAAPSATVAAAAAAPQVLRASTGLHAGLSVHALGQSWQA